MKCFAKCIMLTLSLILLTSGMALAQEWSKQQQEVWQNVETYWKLDAERNLDGFMSYFHADYSGWFSLDALPSDKSTVRKFVKHDFENTQIMVQNIKPVAIQIHGNIAIVHYYYARLVKNAEGKERNRNGRWTDILMKQGDKWVLIGDHGGPRPRD